MAQKTKAANPGTIYITFGLVAAVSLIMSTFIGTGLAIWYPSLDKPELTLALPFTFMIRIFLISVVLEVVSKRLFFCFRYA